MFDVSLPRLKPESKADEYLKDNLEISRITTLKAAATNAWLDSPDLSTLLDIAGYRGLDPDMLYLQEIYNADPRNKKYTEEEFATSHGDSGLQYDPNFTPAIVERILEKKRKMAINDYIIANGKGDLLDKAGQMVGGIIGGNIAPVNLATNIATGFIPGGALFKGAWWAANPVKTNMVKFAIGGGIGQAALEPLIARQMDLEQREYGISYSLKNIAEASLFSASLPAIGYGIKTAYVGSSKFARGKYQEFRNRYFATPEELKSEYSANDSVLDMQFRHLVDELALETAPAASEVVKESFDTLNLTRKNIRNEGKQKFPEFFEMEDKVASLEDRLHKEFATGGDLTLLPKEILSVLDNHRNNLKAIYKKFEDVEEFKEILENLNLINEQISSKLKQEQQEIKGYDFDQTDLAIARNQLETDKYVDLDDPKNARSIFEEKDILHTEQELQKQIQELEQVARDLPEYAGCIQELKQILARGIESQEDINLIRRDKLINLIRFENAKQIIIARAEKKGVKDGFTELLKQADMRGVVVSSELSNGLMNDLIKSDLLDYFRNKNFEKDIAQELWNISHPNKKPTNSKIAKDIADLVHKRQQSAINRINNGGAHINQLEGYITRQSHNALKIKQAGFEKWKNFILPLLEVEKLDEDIDLYQIWKNLATGNHLYQNIEYMPRFAAYNNIAGRFAQPRKLHFKSADSWLKYNNEYGTHSLAHSIAINLKKLGHNIGLIESMGSEPLTLLAKLKNDFANSLQEAAAKGNKAAQEELDFLSSRRLEGFLEYIIGISPENLTLASIGQSLRNVKTMASLGKVAVSSIPDSATFVAEQMYNGIPYIEAQSNLLKAVTNSFNSEQKKEFARLLGCGTDNLMGMVYSNLNVENYIAGKIAGKITTATNYYFKLNLMDWWDNSFKSALGFVLSNHLAHYTKRSYKNAPIELKNNLKRYGIDEKDWQILKSFIKKADDSREYIIPPEWTAGSDQINETATKFKTYLKDRVDTGIPTAHGLERYVATWKGTKAGTPAGEAIRMLMQFKQFPITYIMRPLRDYSGSPKTLSTMIVLATIGGYLSLSANKLLNGEGIPELNLRTLQESAEKGGGLGFYGDFIFGQYNRYGHNIFQSMSGPIPSDIADFFKIYGDLKEGKEEQAIHRANSLIHRNIPGRNLFYLAPALRASGVSQEWIDRNLNAKNIK
jgi:hypothetical protein